MPTFHSKSEDFYQSVENSEEISEGLKKIIAKEDSGFFELCKKYADIGINAPKFRENENTLSVQGVFQFKDIDAAKNATVKFVSDKGIKCIEEFLTAINVFYPSAVEWDDKRQTHGVIMEHSMMGGVGTYINFAELPDDQWEHVKSEVLELLKN